MDTKKTFCEECRDDVEYAVKPVPLSGSVKGREYRYSGQEARCAVCGSLVYLPEINDANLEALYDVFREENGIISRAEVRAIPEKYDIGKRPLSLLLGWGEQTFTRYYDGDTPSRQYSDILRRVYNDPRFYAELLEENKENLKSPAAYEKSRRAVETLLAAETSADAKIDAVTEYLLNRCGDITALALQKALYYVQGFYYAFFDAFLFPQDCQAWTHGPVYREVYFRYRNRFEPPEKAEAFDDSAFSAGEKAVLDSVIDNLCCYSGRILERFTHAEKPWLAARGALPNSARSENVIEKTDIGDYFKAVKEKYGMLNPGGIQDYARDMLQKI